MTVSTPSRTSKKANDMPLDEAYFIWLYGQVSSVKNRNRSKTYWKLLRILYGKEFTWYHIEKDENRAQDGRDLRREFLRENEDVVEDPDWLEMGCSILELLIALSGKLAFEGGGEPYEWFWVLIENLSLIECTDANPPDELFMDNILNRVINREYASNGAGGLFPLQWPNENQRDVEIWYQANAYLLERL